MKPLCFDKSGNPIHLQPRDIDEELASVVPPRHLKFYVEHRARGHHPEFCFTSIFGDHVASGEYLRVLADMFDSLTSVRKAVKDERDSLSINQLWNPRIAVAELDRMINSPVVSRANKISAARQRDLILSGYPQEVAQ
jgi:hypothetical protein